MQSIISKYKKTLPSPLVPRVMANRSSLVQCQVAAFNRFGIFNAALIYERPGKWDTDDILLTIPAMF